MIFVLGTKIRIKSDNNGGKTKKSPLGDVFKRFLTDWLFGVAFCKSGIALSLRQQGHIVMIVMIVNCH